MKFTNMTRAGIYFTCCHREVAPGDSFFVPWLVAQRDRALLAAMSDGVVAWESGKDEPHVPGSRRAPTESEKSAMAAKARAASERAAKARDAEVKARVAKDDAGVREHMSRMGEFKVPGPIPRRTPERRRAGERPITTADIITTGKPRSLADIVRHNKAVQMARAAKALVDKAKAGDAGRAKDSVQNKGNIQITERKNRNVIQEHKERR